MDISNPAALVNAELLHFYVGSRVRVVMQVVRSDGVVIGKSTDEKQLVVKGSPPPAPHTTYVEVYGAEIWTNFGDAIDMDSYNKLCQLANGEFKHLFLAIQPSVAVIAFYIRFWPFMLRMQLLLMLMQLICTEFCENISTEQFTFLHIRLNA
ncbi:hypothetical protein JHK82_054122 [Glycine max]|nr:hypothetical protein JHK86_053969 [Glycine max]KAG4916473.1 hypothetical protein JHK87_054030 [Glycine soja]KAG4928440.1 hypothetical protein JHK85_054926 [Glycine max]KAG5086725.1 hypothetical protein JHK82_054122 [Glycine max]